MFKNFMKYVEATQEPISVSELARKFNVSQPSVSLFIKRSEPFFYIQRIGYKKYVQCKYTFNPYMKVPEDENPIFNKTIKQIKSLFL